jgi:hypothetical protein
MPTSARENHNARSGILFKRIKRRIQDAFGTAGEIEADATVTVDAMVAEYGRD